MTTIKALSQMSDPENAEREHVEMLVAIHKQCSTWKDTLDSASILHRLHEHEFIILNKTEHRTITSMFEQKPSQSQHARVSEIFDKYTSNLRSSWNQKLRGLLAKNSIYPGFDLSKCQRAEPTATRLMRLGAFNMFVCNSWKTNRSDLEKMSSENTHVDATMRHLSIEWAKLSKNQKAVYTQMADAHNKQIKKNRKRNSRSRDDSIDDVDDIDDVDEAEVVLQEEGNNDDRPASNDDRVDENVEDNATSEHESDHIDKSKKRHQRYDTKCNSDQSDDDNDDNDDNDNIDDNDDNEDNEDNDDAQNVE
jgi:hypothetical protein